MSPRPRRITPQPTIRDLQTLGALLAIAIAVAATPSLTRSSTCPAPSITGLSTSHSVARGGVHVTIFGTNFLVAGPPVVHIGYATVTPDSATDTRIVVTTPPLLDGAKPALLVSGGGGRESNPVPFTYDDAVVDAAPPLSLSHGRGTLITITGHDFASSFPAARFECSDGSSVPAPVLRASDTSIVVEAPDIAAPTATLKLGIVHRDIAARNVLLDQGMVIQSVSPPAPLSTGGFVITITGSDFLPGARAVLESGGRSDDLETLSQSSTELRIRVHEGLAPRVGSSETALRVQPPVANAGPDHRSVAVPITLDASPAVRLLSPPSTSSLATTPLTIRGRNFRAGTEAHVGPALTLTTTFVSPFELHCDVPALPAGPQTLQLVGGGSASPPVDFTVLDPPTVASVSPPAVTGEGGALLTIIGANFGAGDPALPITAVVEQAGAPPKDNIPIRWSAPEVLLLTVPPGVPGPATLRLLVNGVEVVQQNAFFYAPAQPPTAPHIDSTSPASLERSGGQVVTLFGSNFDTQGDGSAQVLFGSKRVAPTMISDGRMEFVQPPVPPSNPLVPIAVEVHDRGSNPVTLAPPAPAITSLDGGAQSLAGGQLITLIGHDFAPDAHLHLSRPVDDPHLDIGASVVSATEIVFNAPELGSAGACDVSVVQDGASSNTASLDYVGPDLAALSSRVVSPSGTTVLTITGSNFGVAAGNVMVNGRICPDDSWDLTTIHVPIRSRTSASTDAEDVIRIETATGALSDSLRVRWAPATATALSASAVRASGGSTVTIYGSDFGPATVASYATAPPPGAPPTVLDRSAGIVVIAVAVGSEISTRLGVADPGVVPPTSLPFELLAPPTLESVTPASGPLAGGTVITIHGANFGPAGTAVRQRFDHNPCDTDEISADPSRIICTTPPGVGGWRTLFVTVDGVTDSLPNAFYYTDATGVDPALVPHTLALSAAPSPFRTTLGLRFALPLAGRWQLDVFDAQGARVRRFDGEAAAGEHSIAWDGRSHAGATVAAGVYFARLSAHGNQRVARFVKLE